MKSFLCIVGVFTLIAFTHGLKLGDKIDVQAEVSKITQKFEKYEKPSPEVIENFMEQLQESCRVNRTFDNATMVNASICVGNLFNMTELNAELESAIPKGALEDVFKNVCLRWPKVKTCLKDPFQILKECWEQGDQIILALDSMVEFFCEHDNSGARIALFFAEGGLTCLETHGEEVRTCVNKYIKDDKQDLCSSISQINSCLSPLKKCKDVTPENLVSSMVRFVGKSLSCPPLPESQSGRMKDGTSSTSKLIPLASIFLLTSFAYLLQS